MHWLLPLLSLALFASEAGVYPMRERVFCDPVAGYSFRYPYSWLQQHQYKVDLYRTFTENEGAKLGEVKATKEKKPPPLPCDAHAFNLLVAESGEDLTAIGDQQAKAELAWNDFDYYRADPVRPHADSAWALPGISAKLGTAQDRCVLVVRYGDRISGVVLKGSSADADNRRLLGSFEILALEVKPKPGAIPPKTPPRLMTRREAMARKGLVLNADGKPIPGDKAVGKTVPVPWPQAWEIETEHYHILANTSPQRLAFHAAYFEALFKAYSGVYQPERMPPYKFEVHIFDRANEFQAAAAEHGSRLPAGGGIIGGFFSPTWLSLWVYEESGKLGGSDFTVEHVSAHECSHQFLHVACNGSSHVPTWINEGLAVYFEAGLFRNGEFVTRPPVERIQRLRQLYEQQKRPLQPMDQYLNHHGHIGPDNYGEVYAMVHYWFFGTCQGSTCKHKDCGRALFREYWNALKDGEDGATAFDRVFMTKMIAKFATREAAIAKWDEVMLEYVRKQLK